MATNEKGYLVDLRGSIVYKSKGEIFADQEDAVAYYLGKTDILESEYAETLPWIDELEIM